MPGSSLGPSDHATIRTDLIYALSWLDLCRKRNRNITLARSGDPEAVIAGVRDVYRQGNTTRLYAATLYYVDPDVVATVTRNLVGYEENHAEQYRRSLVEAEEELRKAAE